MGIATSMAAAGSAGGGGSVFLDLYRHVLPHRLGFEPLGIPIYNLQIFQLLAVALMLVVFGWVRLRIDAQRPWVLLRVFRGWVLWIRDEMVVPVLGEEQGRRFLPYFLFVFFFVAFMNLLGLVPGMATATASIFVTMGLAATSLVLFVAAGMKSQGPVRFWLNLVPHGLPAWLWPLMFVVELIGLVVKPFALMIRLFANMVGGHLVVLSFMGVIFFFAAKIGPAAYAVAGPSTAFAVFILIIEAFVALLQAFVFTMLTIIFTGSYVHPDH